MNEEIKLIEGPKCRCDFLMVEDIGELRRCRMPAKPRFWTNFMTGEQEVRNLCDLHAEENQVLIQAFKEFNMMIDAGVNHEVACNTIIKKLVPFTEKNF